MNLIWHFHCQTLAVMVNSLFKKLTNKKRTLVIWVFEVYQENKIKTIINWKTKYTLINLYFYLCSRSLVCVCRVEVGLILSVSLEICIKWVVKS